MSFNFNIESILQVPKSEFVPKYEMHSFQQRVVLGGLLSNITLKSSSISYFPFIEIILTHKENKLQTRLEVYNVSWPVKTPKIHNKHITITYEHSFSVIIPSDFCHLGKNDLEFRIHDDMPVGMKGNTPIFEPTIITFELEVINNAEMLKSDRNKAF